MRALTSKEMKQPDSEMGNQNEGPEAQHPAAGADGDEAPEPQADSSGEDAYDVKRWNTESRADKHQPHRFQGRALETFSP
jgi:hypothetical protein